MLAPAQGDCLFGPQVSATSEFLLIEFAGAEEMEVDRVAMVAMMAMVDMVDMVDLVDMVDMVDITYNSSHTISVHGNLPFIKFFYSLRLSYFEKKNKKQI